jgi:hypothetical protein
MSKDFLRKVGEGWLWFGFICFVVAMLSGFVLLYSQQTDEHPSGINQKQAEQECLLPDGCDPRKRGDESHKFPEIKSIREQGEQERRELDSCIAAGRLDCAPPEVVPTKAVPAAHEK